MKSTFYTQFNGSNKPVNISTQLFTPIQLASFKHPREESRSDDSAMETTDPCSSALRSARQRKRFKPDITRCKHRTANPVPETLGGESLPNGPIVQPASVAESGTSTAEEGSHESGSACSGEDEADEEEGHRHLQKNSAKDEVRGPVQNMGNSEKEGGNYYVPPCREGSTTASTMTLENPIKPPNEDRLDKRPDSKIKRKNKAERKRKVSLADLEKAASERGYTFIAQKSSGTVFRCSENHKVVLPSSQSLAELACRKCAKKYAKCIEFALNNKGIFSL